MKKSKKPRKALEKALNIKVSIGEIDYKNVPLLKKFLSSRYKLLSQKASGLSAKKQRKLKTEVKKARIMGLIPFTDRHAIN